MIWRWQRHPGPRRERRKEREKMRKIREEKRGKCKREDTGSVDCIILIGRTTVKILCLFCGQVVYKEIYWMSSTCCHQAIQLEGSAVIRHTNRCATGMVLQHILCLADSHAGED